MVTSFRLMYIPYSCMEPLGLLGSKLTQHRVFRVSTSGIGILALGTLGIQMALSNDYLHTLGLKVSIIHVFGSLGVHTLYGVFFWGVSSMDGCQGL